MKYMLLMQFSEAQTTQFPPIGTWPAEDLKAHIAFMVKTNQELAAAGELADAQGLAMPETARIVRSRSGSAPMVTEGPFPATKEFLAGYWIVEVESPERAIEIAAHVSTAPGMGGAPLNIPIEVREIMSAPPVEQ